MTDRELYLLTSDWIGHYKAYGIKQLDVIYNPVTDALCRIGSKGSTLIISHRGTTTFKDVITDLLFRFKRVPYLGTNPKIKVHTGFIDRYLSIRPQVNRLVRGYKKVLIIGHSLGACVSQLHALDIQYNWNINAKVITFGSARLGNKAFKKSFESRVKDIKNYHINKDIVPHLPPVFFGFKSLSKVMLKSTYCLFDVVSNHMRYDQFIKE